MKILNNSKRTIYMYTKQNNCFDYRTLSGTYKRIKTGDLIKIERFKLPCPLGYSEEHCRGCIVPSDSNQPVCMLYGNTYGVEEVIE